MEITEDDATMTGGELADIIEAYNDAIAKDPERRKENKERLKRLLFDFRTEFVFALRLLDAEEEIKGSVAQPARAAVL